MTEARTLELDGTHGRLTGTLLVPAGAATRVPAVLVCAALGVEPAEARELPGVFQAALAEAGVASAIYDRVAAPNGTRHSDARNGSVDAAAALLGWLAEQPGVDPARLGVLGYSTAAIVAACLSGRSDRIAGLCLVSPVHADTVAGGMLRNGAARSDRAATDARDEGFDPVDEAALHDRTTLLVHGAADREEPAETSFEYLRRLEHKARRATHVLIARGDHAFLSPAARSACVEQVVDFFVGMSPRPVAA